MPGADLQIIGLVAAWLAIEAAKFFYAKAMAQRAKQPGLTEKQADQLRDLHKWHDESDADGRKLWYFPAQVHDNQEETLEIMRGLASNQEKTALLLEQLLRHLERDERE